VKFTDRGEVRLAATSDGETLTLRVSDTGRGIPEGVRDRIFEDYFQGDNPHRDRSAGLGLGLSIVRRLVALLDGSIRLESEPGRGSAFELSVPAPLASARGAAAQRSDVMQAPRQLPFHSVLVVDDDELVRDSMATLLEPYGVDVRFASNAGEALALVERDEFRPRAAVLDFGLPGGIDGIALAAALRERLPAVRTLLITGDTRPELLRRASDEGIAVLHKPFTAARLAAALEGLAEGRATA
jgi:CheY-like chemotaxis protein